MSVHDLNIAMLAGAAVLLVAVLAVRISTKVGLPSLLLYLALGMLLGEAGLGVRFDDARMAQLIGTGALVVILAEGGLTTRWATMRPALPTGILLATVGVAVSVGIVAAAAHWLLDFEWRLALLVGAIVSSTDAAAVFSTLRRLRLAPRLSAVLEVESGLNDAPAVLLVSILTSGAISGGGEIARTILLMIYELGAGAVIGAIVGAGGVWLLRRSALPAAGLYPLAAVGLTVLAYGAGAVAHASGFLAVYVAAVVLGNARLPHHRAVLGFADGFAWLAQIGLFVLLGLLVSPDELGGVIVPALVLGAVLAFVARPMAVLSAVAPLRVWVRSRFGSPARRPSTWVRQSLFLSWAGLRGAVPIVFATIPLAADISGAQRVFNIVFVLVIVFTLIQGTTLPVVARFLGVLDKREPSDLRVESAPLEELGADLLHLSVPATSRMNGVYVDELRLPPGAVVSLVVRNGEAFVPASHTRVRAGDELLMVAAAQSREAAEQRLRAVGERGRLASWLGPEPSDRG